MSLITLAIWVSFISVNVYSYRFFIPVLPRVKQKYTLDRCCLPEAFDLTTGHISQKTPLETINISQTHSDNISTDASTLLQSNSTVTNTSNENQIDINDILSSNKYFHWDIIGAYFNTFLLKFIHDEDIVDITTKTLSGLVWFAFILGILGTIGFDTKPILSIFGIAGITLGLSLKDVFGDIYAGIFVLFTRPFRRGTYISLGEYSGKVISMNMRYVRLYNSKEKVDVLLPVSLVYKNAIKITVPEGRNRKF